MACVVACNSKYIKFFRPVSLHLENEEMQFDFLFALFLTTFTNSIYPNFCVGMFCRWLLPAGNISVTFYCVGVKVFNFKCP